MEDTPGSASKKKLINVFWFVQIVTEKYITILNKKKKFFEILVQIN